ncbi:hypothetical protein ACFY7C_37410 [Streptomyces sp. NPDC012769]|uniref:hypothetical protein n=1 Tax=Streptomyces sp. NPDC012769 TaxID=3364848 RepID=UPI00368105D1
MAVATVGRIVHYIDAEEVCKAGIVTAAAGDGTVNLTIFGAEGGMAAYSSVPSSDTAPHPHGSWHFPEVA